MRRALVFALTLALGAGLSAEAQTARNATTVSRLPPCNVARQGYPMNVNDADPDCTHGSGVAGSKYVICQCDPLLGWLTYEPGDGYVEGATAGGGLVLTGVNLGLLTTCANGQVLKWTASGATWGCATIASGPTNYAASASPAGPAASALSVTGFTASKCARFNGSGNLVAASGDCSAGDTDTTNPGTVSGTVGSTADAIPTASGTGGSTLQASTVKVVSGNLVLPAGGQVAGSDGYARTRCVAADNACGTNLGPAGAFWRLTNSQGDTGTFSLSGQAGSSTNAVYSYTGDEDTGTSRSAANTISMIAGGVEVGRVTVDRLMAVIATQTLGRTAPPYTCDAAAEGSTYYDSDIHDHCDCVGSSPAWSPRHLVGSCS